MPLLRPNQFPPLNKEHHIVILKNPMECVQLKKEFPSGRELLASVVTGTALVIHHPDQYNITKVIFSDENASVYWNHKAL